MTDAPPINRPTPEQGSQWDGWTDREMLIAILTRVNGIAGLMIQVAGAMPEAIEFFKKPMIKAALKLVVKQDKSNE